jgi:hypothetical protein
MNRRKFILRQSENADSDCKSISYPTDVSGIDFRSSGDFIAHQFLVTFYHLIDDTSHSGGGFESHPNRTVQRSGKDPDPSV